jgi:chorismate dehydratase
MVSPPTRLGAVRYLNAAPIVYGLDADPRFTVLRETPARLADLLRAGQIDLGLIPSIEYVAGDYRIVPGIAIASAGPVRSVSLFHQVPLEAVKTVALDASSRTSAALLKVLLHERLGRQPEYVVMPPRLDEMLGRADAALMIGDPALGSQAERPRLDLGAEWTAQTGLPFVYAFWAGPAAAAPAATVSRLREALRAGLGAIPQIALAFDGKVPGHAADNESYLRSSIVYRFGDREQAGLREFYRRAHALGLIARVPEIRFHGHP